MQDALTVEGLIAKLRQLLNTDKIQLTDSIVWTHREWGCVAVADVVPVDHAAANDPGLYGCVTFVPCKHVPKETSDHYFEITVERVPGDQKIATIKAFRMVTTDLKGSMGLAEAKQAVESVPIFNGGSESPGRPYVFSPIPPHLFKQCEAYFVNIPGLHYSSNEHNPDTEEGPFPLSVSST